MNWDRKASDCILKGKFEKALGYVKHISSYKLQEEIISLNVVAYVINKLATRKDFEVDFTTDRAEYEQFINIVGLADDHKVVLYENKETGMINGECKKTLAMKILAQDNPLLKYLVRVKLFEEFN